MKIHERIRQYIEANGLKKKFVAEKANINLKRFYRLLDGSTSLDVDEYVNICRNGLSLSPCYFLEEGNAEDTSD